MNVCETIKQLMSQNGYEFRTVSITRLSELQEDVARPIRQGLIDRQLSDRWHFYMRANEDLPEAKAIITAAVPQPITRITFEWKGRIFPADIYPNYIYAEDERRIEELLSSVLKKNNHKLVKASLAHKTLAVRSGLAEYGRNNISYVQGLGSFYRLVAFYTDLPCEEETWRESRAMKACENCTLCLEDCPTGSITIDRFLIRAENCLGWRNDLESDNPYWVKYQPDYPTAFIGCMVCQSICPVNKPYLDNVVEGPSFSEEETGQILDAVPLEELSPGIMAKLGVSDGVYPLIPANLKALMEKQKVNESYL